MESIDSLLAEVKAEYEGNQKKSPDIKGQPTLKAEQPRLQQSAKPADRDIFLPDNFSTSLPDNSLIAELRAERDEPPSRQQPATPTYQVTLLPDNFSTSLPDNSLISEMKAEYEEQQKAEELKKQQLLKEEQLRQQQLKQQQRQAMSKQAQDWLKKLDPLSEEGLWFEELAFKYPSKLDAAIDYLQALEENKP